MISGECPHGFSRQNYKKTQYYLKTSNMKNNEE